MRLNCTKRSSYRTDASAVSATLRRVEGVRGVTEGVVVSSDAGRTVAVARACSRYSGGVKKVRSPAVAEFARPAVARVARMKVRTVIIKILGCSRRACPVR
jgi:hypothetical protein